MLLHDGGDGLVKFIDSMVVFIVVDACITSS